MNVTGPSETWLRFDEVASFSVFRGGSSANPLIPHRLCQPIIDFIDSFETCNRLSYQAIRTCSPEKGISLFLVNRIIIWLK